MKTVSPSLPDCSRSDEIRARPGERPDPRQRRHSGRCRRWSGKCVHANVHAHRPPHAVLCVTSPGQEVPPDRTTKPS